MLWPDDESNAKKPRYSAETGNRLLRNKSELAASRVPIDASLLTKYVDIDLDNLQNDYIKLKERLAVVSQERDDATNKVCTVVLMFDLLAKSIIATRRN